MPHQEGGTSTLTSLQVGRAPPTFKACATVKLQIGFLSRVSATMD
jgi:hypothetical protein